MASVNGLYYADGFEPVSQEPYPIRSLTYSVIGSGGSNLSYGFSDPYVFSGSTSTGGMSYQVQPLRERTSLEWLAAEVEAVCRKGRL